MEIFMAVFTILLCLFIFIASFAISTIVVQFIILIIEKIANKFLSIIH